MCTTLLNRHQGWYSRGNGRTCRLAFSRDGVVRGSWCQCLIDVNHNLKSIYLEEFESQTNPRNGVVEDLSSESTLMGMRPVLITGVTSEIQIRTFPRGVVEIFKNFVGEETRTSQTKIHLLYAKVEIGRKGLCREATIWVGKKTPENTTKTVSNFVFLAVFVNCFVVFYRMSTRL